MGYHSLTLTGLLIREAQRPASTRRAAEPKLLFVLRRLHQSGVPVDEVLIELLAWAGLDPAALDLLEHDVWPADWETRERVQTVQNLGCTLCSAVLCRWGQLDAEAVS